MQYKKVKLCALLLLGIGMFGLQAQNAIPASGGNATGAGGTISYSVGQVFYSRYAGTNGSVAQGVQQAYEISVITEIEKARDISLEMAVYPNPATDYLILKINGVVETRGLASLYNVNGTLLQTVKVETNQTTISMQAYMPGTYFLKINVETQNLASPREIKTFKIIKN